MDSNSAPNKSECYDWNYSTYTSIQVHQEKSFWVILFLWFELIRHSTSQKCFNFLKKKDNYQTFYNGGGGVTLTFQINAE